MHNPTSHLYARFVRALCLTLVCLLGFESVVWAAPTITYLHNDTGGSPVAATDATGTVVWRESYRPYGERTKNEAAAGTNTQFFHGKPVDGETGLSYFGARYYDPVVGRFMGIDPVGFDEANIHSFNRYAYGNNNPYKYRDPDGNFAILIPLLGLLGGAGLVLYANQGAQVTPGRSGWDHRNDRPLIPPSALSGNRHKNLLFNEDANSQGTEAKGTGAPQKDVTKRPSRVRKGTEQSNWDNAQEGENGGRTCSTCDKEVHSKPGEKFKDWDNDHNPPWRDRDLTEKDRKGVLDEYNRDTRLRCVGCNRSDNGN